MPKFADGPSQILEGLEEHLRKPMVEAYKRHGGTFSSAWGNTERRAMADAIFEVENDLEHAAVRTGAMPSTSKKCARALVVVADLRARRNLLLDAAGENEVPPLRLVRGAA